MSHRRPDAVQAGKASTVQAVLFDLDGTLIDSAPDLVAAANALLQEHQRPPMPLAVLRPHAGSGARGLLSASFQLTPGDAAFEPLKARFLDHYAARLMQHTRVFDGVRPLLDALADAGLPWGIVTNKATRFAAPLVAGLDDLAGCGVLVCGDTTAHAKPHPQPLLHAARQLGVQPAHCIYIGDDARDIAAGHAAGMQTVVAEWGYLGPNADPPAWQAHALLKDPAALHAWLDLR